MPETRNRVQSWPPSPKKMLTAYKTLVKRSKGQKEEASFFSLDMRVGFGLLLLFLSGLWRPCLAQDARPSSEQGEPAPKPAPDDPPTSVFPERAVNWRKLVPNLAHDQKDIWLFPISLAGRRHLKPALVVTAITAGAIAVVDVHSGKYFQRTQSFGAFNRVFSGKNTSVAMVAAPSVFYGISFLRKNFYDQHTFLLAGERCWIPRFLPAS